MFTDASRQQIFDPLRDHDLRVFAKRLPFDVFAAAARRAQVRIGTCPLHGANLVWLQRIAQHQVPVRPGRRFPRKKKAKGKTAKSKRKKS